MASVRKRRLEELFREEISRLVIEELADPRIGFATVTGVELDDDLQRAVVSVSFFLPEGKRSAAIAALNSSAGHVRHLLAPYVHLKKMPELLFRLDESIERSAHIADLIKQAKADGAPQRAKTVPPGPQTAEKNDEDKPEDE
jgi:ribosome-binding factor A